MSLPMPMTDASLPRRAPSPPDDPPGVRRGSYGFLATPNRGVLHSNESMVCGIALLTKGMPPA